ncbi:TetR/AcrR family transcriptional regulator [Clostridium felsineum]|nr:TetR-like C-terminal domain-containing protein [Clostridium felsineum]
MKNKDVQAITVQNLVDEAQIARSTFYSLYEDKQDFLNQIIDNMFYQLREQTKPEKFDTLSDFYETACYRCYMKHFEYIEEHSEFFKVMLGNHGISSFRKRMEDSAVETYEEIFKYIDETKLPIPKDYLIQYVISAHIGLTFKWLRDGMKYSAIYMAELVSRITFKGIFISFSLELLQ